MKNKIYALIINNRYIFILHITYETIYTNLHTDTMLCLRLHYNLTYVSHMLFLRSLFLVLIKVLWYAQILLTIVMAYQLYLREIGVISYDQVSLHS